MGELATLNTPLVSAKSNVFENFTFAPVCLPDYSTVEDYFKQIAWPAGSKELTYVFLNGIRLDDWDYMVQPGDHVQFVVVPGGGEGGGKQAMMLIAAVAISIFSAGIASGAIFGTYFTSANVVLGLSSAQLAGLAVGVVGNLLIGAVFKPPVASNNNVEGMAPTEEAFAPSAMITAQSNRARIGGVIPKIFGHHRIFPDLAAVPYVIKSACKQTLHALYCTGYYAVPNTATAEFGGINIQALLVQDQNDLVRQYPGKVYYKLNADGITGYSTGQPGNYHGRHESESIGFNLPLIETLDQIDEEGGADMKLISTIVQSANGSDECYLDFVFPSGLFRTDSSGVVVGHRATVKIQTGSGGDWKDIENSDFIEEGLSSCMREEAAYIEGSIEKENFVQQYWGEISKVVSGDADSDAINIVAPSKDLYRDDGYAFSDQTRGLWNGGEGEDNKGPDSGKNVYLFDFRYTDWITSLEVIEYHCRREVPGKRFNIYYDMKPNAGGSFAAGTYRFEFFVSSAAKYNTFEGTVGILDRKGYMWASSQATAGGIRAESGYTTLTSGDQPQRFWCQFELGATVHLGDYVRIGFTLDQGYYDGDPEVIELHQFRFHELRCMFTTALDQDETIEPEIIIAVKNTLEVPEYKRMTPPSRGFLFYPATDAVCDSNADYNDQDVAPEKCFEKLPGGGYTVIADPVVVGVTDNGRFTEYRIFLV